MTKTSFDIDSKYDPLVRVTLAGLPELDLFPSDEDRKRALADLVTSNRHIPRKFRNIVGSLGFVYVLFPLLIKELLKSWTGLPLASVYLISIFMSVAIAFLIRLMLDRKYLTRALREKLISVDVPICVPCGYLLRGLPPTTERCPECGKEISSEVRALLTKASEPHFQASTS